MGRCEVSIIESEADLTAYAGPGRIGMVLSGRVSVAADAAVVAPLGSVPVGHANGLCSLVTLLYSGRNDFDIITGLGEDADFAVAPGSRAGAP